MHEKQFYGRGPGGFHRIAYVEWGQASAQPPVICVHGLARNGRDSDYNYAQYLTDMTTLIARTGAESVDWVGTSMGGRIGMMLAAEANTPIRRLVINDAGRFIPRIGAHVGQSPVFDDWFVVGF
jgi:pimeloyl-ACP methyl ester carboxylesterase